MKSAVLIAVSALVFLSTLPASADDACLNKLLRESEAAKVNNADFFKGESWVADVDASKLTPLFNNLKACLDQAYPQRSTLAKSSIWARPSGGGHDGCSSEIDQVFDSDTKQNKAVIKTKCFKGEKLPQGWSF